MQIVYLVLYCENLEKSRAFYSALGLSFVQEKHDRGPLHWSTDLGGLVLELYPRGTRPPSSVRLGWETVSTAPLKESLLSLGGAPAGIQEKGEVFLLRDPDGNRLEILLLGRE